MRAEFHPVEHHLAHLSSAFHVGPFDQAAVVSVDGFGDFSSAAWGTAAGCEISTHGRVYFPHSLGIFYQAITQYLGFPHYGDEYKVMGLAPYGRPLLLDAMRKIVRLLPDGGFELDLKFFRHHREDVPYQWADGSPEFGDLFSPALEDLLGPRRLPTDPLEDRHRDIARSAQAMYEEAFFHLLAYLQERSGLTDLALAGGCAMNSVANGKVRRMTPFRRVYVQAAAGDAGGAIGCGICRLAQARRQTHVRDGPCLLGAGVRRCGYSTSSLRRTGRNFLPPVARSRRFPTRRRYVGAPPRRLRTGRSSAGFRGGWNGVRAHSAIARSCATRAAPT